MEAAVAHASADYLRLARQAKLLSWASLAYMAVEGLVAIAAGIVAGSIALIGFGLDSAIEGFASVVIVWRFTGSRTLSHRAEERAQKLVALQFFILAPHVAVESIRTLVDGSRWRSSGSGCESALRRRQARASRTSSARTWPPPCSWAWSATRSSGAWWLDPLVGLLIAGLAVHEGREAWHGDACCH